MSDERTATTKEVRDGYAYDGYSEDIDPYYELRFDRWLAAHDAEIRTATLDEAAVIVKGNLGRIWIVAETLGDIAAAIHASKVDPR